MLWSWSRVEVEGLGGGKRWVEKGKGGHTMTFCWLSQWGYWSWYGVQGCKYVCGGPLEDPRIPCWPFLFHFSVISWNCLVSFLHVIKLCLLSWNSKFPSFFPFFLSKSFFSCSMSYFFFCKHLSCFSLCGLSPKGGIGVLVYIWPTTFSTCNDQFPWRQKGP